MSKKKRALSGAGTPSRAAETAALTGATFPERDSITAAAGRQSGFIAALLSHGAENGLTIHHLEKMTDLKSRDIRKRIEFERQSGIPILSNCKDGYFLPGTEDEAKRFIRSMRGRAAGIMRTASAVERAVDGGNPTQETVEGW